jgi:hypothetical protein
MVVLDRLLSGKQAELALGAGVVKRDVQRPEGADGLFDERDDVILPADIGLHEQRASTGRSDLPGDLLSLGNASAGDDHIRSFLGKREGGGSADAGGASSDEDSFVFEGFHSWPQRSEYRAFGQSEWYPGCASDGFLAAFCGSAESFKPIQEALEVRRNSLSRTVGPPQS